MRLPSHGMCEGSPPKLQGQEMVQLQLSATVAVSCHDGCRATEGTVSAMTRTVTSASMVRMRTIYTNLQAQAHHRFVRLDVAHRVVERLPKHAGVEHHALESLGAAVVVHRIHQAFREALLAMRR